MSEKIATNEEFGVDHSINKGDRRGSEEFKNTNFVNREFRPPVQNTSMNNMKQFTIKGQPIK